MPVKRLIAIVLFAGFAVWGCSGPKPPEPVELGPAAIISLDTVTTGQGRIEVPLRLEYLPGGKDRIDALAWFTFRMSYDTSLVTFKGITGRGEPISQWRTLSVKGDQSSFGGTEDPILGLQLTGYRLLSGHSDPEELQGHPEGVLTSLVFDIAPYSSLSGKTAPIHFLGGGCFNNTLLSDLNESLFYCADGRLGGASADAVVDSMVCPRRQLYEPVLQFVHGAVQIGRIVEPPIPSPAAIISIDSVTAVPGEFIELPLRLTYTPDGKERLDTLSGFDFLIAYDTTVLALEGNVTRGDAVTSWGKFYVYRNWNISNHGGPLSGVHIQAARLLGSGGDPMQQQGYPEGILTTLRFRVTTDQTMAGTESIVRCLSEDCRENTLYSNLNTSLYYMAISRLGAASADAAFDTTRCSGSQFFEPVLQFVHGSVQIEEDIEPETSSLVGIINADPVTAHVGSEFSVPISIHYPEHMIDPQVGFGGYDLLIEYDTVGIDFVGATRGTATEAWEYFTWRAVPRYCDSCHSQLVRLVSIWDMNNGISPEWSTRFIEGPFAMLQFRADSTAALIKTVNEIRFQTLECGDNTLSSFDGSTLYLADPEDPECDPSAVPPEECRVNPKPDHYIEPKLRFRSGRVIFDAP